MVKYCPSLRSNVVMYVILSKKFIEDLYDNDVVSILVQLVELKRWALSEFRTCFVEKKLWGIYILIVAFMGILRYYDHISFEPKYLYQRFSAFESEFNFAPGNM